MGMVVCVGGSVGVLTRFVWRLLGVGMGVLGWDGCIFGGLDGLVSEFWTRGIVLKLILTISMSIVCSTQFGQKVEKHSSIFPCMYFLFCMNLHHTNIYVIVQ